MRIQRSLFYRNCGRLLLGTLLLVAAAAHAAVPTVTAPSPSPQTVLAGNTVSFSVTASGTGPFTYAWQYSSGGTFATLADGGRIAGSASATLQITNSQTSDTGNYRCLVSNASGQSNSGPGSLTVNLPPPPTVSAPGNQTVIQGNTASFSVTASGTGPFTYFWQYSNGGTFSTLANGGRISGATSATLQITGTQTSDAGSYRCLVSNAGGQSNSGPGVLTVNLPPPPTVTAPGNQTVTLGGTASFSVMASGTGPFTYFWQYSNGGTFVTLANGTRISGATSAALQITGVQTSDAGSYRCLVSNAGGQSNSGSATLTVNLPPPPTVTAPGNQTVFVGNTASFTVTASGTGPFTYAWQFLPTGGSVFSTLSNGGRISGATGATLQITGVQTTDAGSYRCLVSNAGGQSNSGPATLTIPPPPTVTSPSNQTVFVGATASFSVTASGTGPFTYFWQYSNGGAFTTLANGGRISGATGASLQITNAQTSDAGSYRCLVSNANGQTNSGPATLTVNVPPPPTVTAPGNQTVFVGAAASFTVTASGTGPFTYAWQFLASGGSAYATLANGGRISGAAAATLQIANAQTSDAGSYRCLVSNAGGQSNSGPATLTVNVPTAPTVSQPTGQTIYVGDPAAFSVTVSGSGPFTYAWQYSNGGAFVTLSDGGRISGSATATLSIANAQTTDAGNYRCLVSNLGGQSNSGPAALVVNVATAPTVTQPSGQAIGIGSTALLAVSASGKGPLSYAWQYLAIGASAYITLSDGGKISGTATSTLRIANVQLTDAGNYRCLVSNAIGQTNSGPATLTVGIPDFTLTATPGSRKVTQGDTAVYTITTAPVFGFSSQIALSVSGLPAGCTYSFNPAAISSGGASTLQVFTTATTPTGIATLTLNGTGGSQTHTTSVNLNVQSGQVPDFVLSLGPPSVGVQGGSTATYSVSVAGISGFTGNVALSLSGNPAGTSYTFSPASVAAGGSATLTVPTSTSTPQGTSTLTITGTAGSLSHTATASLVIQPGSAPGAPVVQSITPDSFEGGQVVVITLTGQNFAGASVALATQQADPSNPVDRVFPGAKIQQINTDGTLMTVAIDATDPQIFDFYNLVITNASGQVTSPPFRVLAPGPMVDLWTPRWPEDTADTAYVLSLVGHHLSGVTVTTNAPNSIEVFSVDSSSDDHVNGLLRILPGAPLGDVDLIVSDATGRQVILPVTLVTAGKSLKANRTLTSHRVDPDSFLVQEGPKVFFQEFEMRRPGATKVEGRGFRIRAVPEPVHHKDFSFGIFFSYTYNLVNFHWQSAILFDPVTQTTGDAILHGLGVGDSVRLGAFVLSYYLKVDLTVYIGLDTSGFTFPLFCISITEALEIPGFNGFLNVYDFCAGGAFYSFISGGVSAMQMSGGSCAQVTQDGPPVDGAGEVFGTVQQTACCPQPVGVTATGDTFTGAFFGESFSVDTPNAGQTTPDATCSNNCSVNIQPFMNSTTPPACVARGRSVTYTAQGQPANGTYQWKIAQGSARAMIDGPADQSLAAVRGSQTSSAADDVTLEVDYTVGGVTCAKQAKLSVIDIQLDFRDSGILDSDNLTRNTRPQFGVPQLGQVSPANSTASGFFENMQIKATISPCDAALRCSFDFKRLRAGTAGTYNPVSGGTFTPVPDQDCPQGGCDDDRTDTDEDLILDAAPGCGVYVIDTPGVSSTTCSVGGGSAIACFNFNEWLDVDKARATDDLLWYASTRLKCTSGHWGYDLAGAGNVIGLGTIDCSARKMGELASQAVSADLSLGKALRLLRSGSEEKRMEAYRSLASRWSRGDLAASERQTLIEDLIAAARTEEPSYPEYSTPLLAIQLLGQSASGEAIPVLMDRLLTEFPRFVASDASQATPASQALGKLGRVALGSILDRAGNANEEEWEALRSSLGLMKNDKPAVIAAARRQLAAGGKNAVAIARLKAIVPK